jgi:hypothetical protein
MAFAVINGGAYMGGLPTSVPVPPIIPQIATASNNLPAMLQLLIY